MKRKRTQPSPAALRDGALLQMGEGIFRNPASLIQAHWYCLKEKLYVPSHSHPDLLQLDLMVGVKGTVVLEGREIPLSGVTAFVFYPRQRHAIEIVPEAAQGEFYSVKVKVPPAWEAVRKRVFLSHLKLSVADHYLVKALRQLSRLITLDTAPAAMRSATLGEVLCYWPLSSLDSALTLPREAGEEIGAGMRKALHLIYKRLAAPPSLPELSAVSGMSPRHFLRCFRELFYCSPHAYITQHRLARAREFLTHRNETITLISDELGFPSIHAFSRWFQRAEGISPSAYKQRHFLL